MGGAINYYPSQFFSMFVVEVLHGWEAEKMFFLLLSLPDYHIRFFTFFCKQVFSFKLHNKLVVSCLFGHKGAPKGCERYAKGML